MMVFTDAQTQQMLNTAEAIVKRANEGLPVAEWANEQDMQSLVMAYQYVLQMAGTMALELSMFDAEPDEEFEYIEHRLQ